MLSSMMFNLRLLTNFPPDINECQTEPWPCHVNANCSDTIGSFTCACKPGYTGDGIINCIGQWSLQSSVTGGIPPEFGNLAELPDAAAY